MEHIRQHDWFLFSPPEASFVNEKDIDNCVIEKIISNRFCDPLISSDSEEEGSRSINWDEVFKKRTEILNHQRVFVPGIRGVPPFQRLSALNKQQHFQCIKVIASEYPDVLPSHMVPRPNKADFKLFQEVKEIYQKEQKEFKDWAKVIWTTNNCGRALRPKPVIETVYEAEYKMKSKELQSFPKNFYMAAQIGFDNEDFICKMIHEKDLITVKQANLPRIQYPDPIEKKFLIMRPCPVPEPCNKHPCYFVLPHKTTKSTLPLTEVHRELAQFALDNGSQFIASEGALKCLVETNRDWMIPLSVCEVYNGDGEKHYVKVLGSEFSIRKKPAMSRVYEALRHLIAYAFIPPEEKTKMLTKNNSAEQHKNNTSNLRDFDISSDEDDDKLVIDDDDDSDFEDQLVIDEERDAGPVRVTRATQKVIKKATRASTLKEKTKDKCDPKINDFYSCSCKDSTFETPPLRSYRKWKLKNVLNGDILPVIVHCAHKMRNSSGEVIVEPIPEYVLDLGASKQPVQTLKSIALSLFLRKSASVLNVRVDSATGEVVTIDKITQEKYTLKHGNYMPEISKAIYQALFNMKDLLPGRYILKHEINHGNNALLYAQSQGSRDKLVLNFDFASMTEADEAKSVKNPPELDTVLLPVHKFRKMLPCAFPPFENMLTKETKKPVTRQKPPPQAIKFPKKNNRKKNKKKKKNSRES